MPGFASKDKFAELCPFEEATLGETEKAPSFLSSSPGRYLWMALPIESSFFLSSSVCIGVVLSEVKNEANCGNSDKQS